MVGAIEVTGRLLGAMALGAPLPCADEKLVRALFRKKPCGISHEPKFRLMVVVMDRALPCASTMATWLVSVVPGASAPPGAATPANTPGRGCVTALPDSRVARWRT